jgi:hypothetical protein
MCNLQRASILTMASFWILLSCACRLTATPTPAPPPYPGWLSNWLTAPTCQPPCWENITPGTTVFTDAVKIVQQLPTVSISWGPATDQWGRQAIEWNFGSISTATQDQVISEIRLSIPNNAEPTLKEVFAAYGEPTHVLFTDCRDAHCVVELIYLGKGMLLGFLLPTSPFQNTVNVRSDANVGRISLFPPGASSYATTVGAYAISIKDYYTEWKGYGNYAHK